MKETASKVVKKLMGKSKSRAFTTAFRAGGEVGVATANAKAAQKSADARLQMLDAERLRKMAEMMQQQIEEESEIMKVIMESKNARKARPITTSIVRDVMVSAP